ncbi:phosphoribosylformylglycinamidine cyclo-ligase [Alkalidesulfovibrio alkalitolerans DSM 16529]|jgi:phosphoribosylformylglycinamidine cyclo-ligase|uniref:Phosphoribosylformylglycinamidine cyclo-ligase n=1 Tax=Alkalidesulfovibrio alkalitolerans DSM 16529 TaxID=1121439 RepID=S7T8W8_9BACT|nr:phosphoribosylformylglycinamidine cyclo-ligase [Alkalidesulfovibrio alkalitolerans]EPR32960.1 phosphoribosylformylglycinamidine cyclo-ligase [Alkalidesulfovibrio alkalitolerans DSM 16529]
MSKRTDAYTAAGVDTEAAGRFIDGIKSMVASTYTKGVISDIGGFGGLFKPDIAGMQEPVLVAGTDGVGTKLKLAFTFDRHDTVGIDLVAMSVNDILVQGAKPLFFLDYFATGKLDGDKATTVLQGIVEGCREAECALLGGETAEMPDFYADGEYDLSGFCVGIVDNARIVDGSSIAVGDVIVGLGSTGPHSNGYSLIRKILAASNLSGGDAFPGTDKTVAEVLLAPTRIYVKPIKAIMRDLEIKGMVHITGGGFYDNIPRVLPRGVAARIAFGSFAVPPVFAWLKAQGNLSWPEMLQVFNCGVGYMCIVAPEVAQDVIDRLSGMHIPASVIGRIEPLEKGMEQVIVDFPEDACP